ncbi:MAG: sulfate transporter CysZ [Proteobacteria bacterium]|jgi:CysZ protein|nr:sulfate transporter CysZ [Pseudomonadota bacterium]
MNGVGCFVEGFRLIRAPGLRGYVIIPMVINATVLILLVWSVASEFGGWVDQMVLMLPEWLAFLSSIIWLLSFLIVVFLILFCFTMLANLIASPFNAMLSVRVEEVLLGRALPEVSLLAAAISATRREFSKLAYLLPRLLALVVLSLIPIVNAVAPLMWLLFGGWMMAIQYCDYAADNNLVSFGQLRRRLAGRRAEALLFGLPVYLMMAIPVLNLILLPVAVAGGTVFWVQHLRDPGAPG